MGHPQGILQKDVFPQIVAIPLRNGREKGNLQGIHRRSVQPGHCNGDHLLLVVRIDLIAVTQTVIDQLPFCRLRHIGIVPVIDAVVGPLCRNDVISVRYQLH